MAYMSQENKASKVPAIKAILKKYGLKGSIAVRHYSTLLLTITSGPIDFMESLNRIGLAKSNRLFTPVTDGYTQVNEYWYHEHFDGAAKDCLSELYDVMNIGNHDNSDIQVDHFDVGWYSNIYIGKWDKPYAYTPKG
jgi:hypothetical protein